MQIREYQDADWPLIWTIFQEIVVTGLSTGQLAFKLLLALEKGS